MAADYFLKLDGITGESTDAKHKGEIQLLSWSFGASNTTSFGGGGHGNGRVSFHDLSFTSKGDLHTPQLLNALLQSTVIPNGVLSGETLNPDGTTTDRFFWKMQNVLVSSFDESAQGTDDPADAFRLIYQKAVLQFFPAQGTPGP